MSASKGLLQRHLTAAVDFYLNNALQGVEASFENENIVVLLH